MDDAEIINMYWQRNEQAIIETDAKYGLMCLRISTNILRNREDAQESVNDTYLTTWNTIPPERPTLLGSFVAKIIRNISLKRLEFNNAKKRKPESSVDFDELAEYLSSDIDIWKALEAKELAASISSFLKKQSCEARLVFLRKYWFMDTNEEIAQRYNTSVGSVTASLFRTRKKLKAFLRKEGYLL